MSTQNYYEDVEDIVYISTNTSMGCKYNCGVKIDPNDFAESVNHYISEHGYKLLHVGQDSKETGKGNPISDTIAVLGK